MITRRDFVKVGVASAAAFLSRKTFAMEKFSQGKVSLPLYRGFNLLEKFSGQGPRRPFVEKDFEIMADWGFNFARLPMSYWHWADKKNWFAVREDVLEDIDQAVEWGRQYGIHINLNLHRIPGYCINNRRAEPVDLYEDTPDNMQKALEGAVFHWKMFARRYKGIPSTQLSFDLINEPPHLPDETRHVEVVRALVEAIRQEDPDRLIMADGKDVGRLPIWGIADLGVVQSTRGYDPVSVSHYQASWMPPNAFQTRQVPTWPLKADDGTIWDKDYLKEKLIKPWKMLESQGVPVQVGEWGCFNKTPHTVALRWMEDWLQLWKEAGWGHALWNLRGDFGVLDSRRTDVQYEKYKGHLLDRRMLELIRTY